MSIEQYLMRALKSEGGLTHGRGLTSSVLGKWVLSMPQCIKVTEPLEDFCKLRPCYSEQHVELRSSREQRDIKDLHSLLEWLEVHNPFNRQDQELATLHTGILASKEINCDSAKEVGQRVIDKSIGCVFGELKLKRNDRVKPLSFIHKTVKVYNQKSSVNPQQLFNRILCSYKSDSSLKECFSYELLSYPMALFEENGLMRKTNKSALAQYFDKRYKPCDLLPENSVFVVDGGHLLHKETWQFPATYREIFQQYVNYLMFTYGINTTVVFDGYSDYYLSTKNQEHIRRSGKNLPTSNIIFNDNTATTLNKEQFLSNIKNKINFIKLLAIKIREAGINVLEAKGDADVATVDCALKIHETCSPVTLVGDDTDLLVLLLFKVMKEGIFMLRPGKVGKPNKVTNIGEMQKTILDFKDQILFLHAMSGCDTTSSFYKKGKLAAIKVLQKCTHLKESISVFMSSTSSKKDIVDAGNKFVESLYGKHSLAKNLDELRYLKYKALTARQAINHNFELATLPPTCKAAENHYFRVYHQIHVWLNDEERDSNLIPKTTSQPIAPNFVLEMIYCNCKSGCHRLCSCIKSNINCSSLCGTCNGVSCNNASPDVDAIELEDEEESS